MALLSDAVVVIEATASSGTQSAVREALRLNKPAFILESLAHHPDVPWVAEN
jgi:predicted Rossmann fold nucleotide-binding protein DprA/Smf involved in DNA uptake